MPSARTPNPPDCSRHYRDCPQPAWWLAPASRPSAGLSVTAVALVFCVSAVGCVDYVESATSWDGHWVPGLVVRLAGLARVGSFTLSLPVGELVL